MTRCSIAHSVAYEQYIMLTLLNLFHNATPPPIARALCLYNEECHATKGKQLAYVLGTPEICQLFFS